MFNNPFSMVVAIVLIVSIAGVLRARYGYSRNRLRGGVDPMAFDNRETSELRDEVRALKDRIAVLERITTDGHEAARIDQEIARLRDR